jgi:hypothetical protein
MTVEREWRVQCHDCHPPGASNDEFGNDERDIRMVAISAHARGDFEAERLALDRLALMERKYQEEKMKHCPRCDSPQPHLHPAVQAGGEVQPCPHEFHKQDTPSNRPPALA